MRAPSHHHGAEFPAGTRLLLHCVAVGMGGGTISQNSHRVVTPFSSYRLVSRIDTENKKDAVAMEFSGVTNDFLWKDTYS
jgi:L,D-peptidoglycan transpeptidase YkuD (ErfK/YbiS/YcfS/YnhG family)